MKTQHLELSFFGRVLTTVMDAAIDHIIEPVALKVADLASDLVVPSIVKARHDVGMSGTRLFCCYIAWSMLRKDIESGNMFIDTVVLDMAREYADLALRAYAETQVDLARIYRNHDNIAIEVH